jgi:hypothetical protein
MKFTYDSKDRIPVTIKTIQNNSDSQERSSLNSDCFDVNFYEQ